MTEPTEQMTRVKCDAWHCTNNNDGVCDASDIKIIFKSYGARPTCVTESKRDD